MWRLTLKSCRYYWRMHLGVFLGVLLASAVLTGALLVGDSVDGSLRDTALARLGNITFALHTPNRFFDRALAEKMDAVPILDLPGVVLTDDTQINQVSILGIDERFSSLAHSPLPPLAPGTILLNEKLADALKLSAGDSVSLRITKPSLMPRDAALSEGNEVPVIRILGTVAAIVTDAQLSRYSLANNQVTPYNAFVDLAWLQERLEFGTRINGILVSSPTENTKALADRLAAVWEPGDIGLTLRTVDSIRQLESDRIYLDAAVAESVLNLPGATGTLVYLINGIATATGSTPYSFALASDTPLKPDEAVLNTWAAEQIGATVGDIITVSYYQLTPANEYEDGLRQFRVSAIVPTESWAHEKDLMLAFPGLTDVESCADWDVGMPMDEDKLEDPDNEAYWDTFGPTPKITVSLEAGQAMWANRFGAYTGIRFPAGDLSDEAILEHLKTSMTPASVGLQFRAVQDEAMQAVDHAIDFGGLFLGMSFFLIVAALIFTGLLFVFGIQQRTREMGILAAMGFTPTTIRRLMTLEIIPTALVGAFAGAVAGMFYARLLLAGLALFWHGAVAGAVIQYHGNGATLITGASSTFICALLTLYATLRRQSRYHAREQLQLDFSLLHPHKKRLPLLRWLPLLGLVATLALAFYMVLEPPDKPAPAFFGLGSLMLASMLGSLGTVFGALQQKEYAVPTRNRLSLQNLARRRGRSLTAVGLLACGCFMIFAVSAMQEDLGHHAAERWSGTGGFELVATTSIPLKQLEGDGFSVVPLRVRDGDDASCLNLNRAQSPTLIGVPEQELKSLQAFAEPGVAEMMWSYLETDNDQYAPALVGDIDTAMWGLQKKAHPFEGDILEYQDEAGNPAAIKLLGMLPMRLSVFQGKILIPERIFTQYFPSESGYRMFLLDAEPEQKDAIVATLRKEYERYGLEVYDSVDWLRTFYTVESTYLGMFLILGGFGMVLGSFALSVVVLRNLLERRTELAMLRAVGFSHTALWKVLALEHGLIVLFGLFIGGVSAGVAMVPAILAANTTTSYMVQLLLFAAILGTALASVLVPVWLGTEKEGFAALRRE